MRVANNRVVSFDYTLTGDDGAEIDSSKGQAPLVYLHGHGGIIPGLENAMKGKKVGDDFKISIPAKEGYGDLDQRLIQKVPRDQFEGIGELKVGMRLTVTSKGGRRMVRVAKIEGDEVTIDGNHELAGKTLHFEIAVRDIRDATKEELDHGHVHGPGGHHHH